MVPDPVAEHRPWPAPTRPWLMRQTWHDLLFAHWPVETAALRALVPPELALDTFEGTAWLGVVPFWMTLRVRGLPALPGFHAFPELNVRTYVTAGGRPGVWFLSLDAGNAVAVAAARRWYHLPYFRARMRSRATDAGIVYASDRVHPGAPDAAFHGTFRPVGPPLPARTGSLEHWLTERYCLYALSPRGEILRGEVDHGPWPLQPAAAAIERNTMAASHGLDLGGAPPLLHFAQLQTVRVWGIRPAGDADR